MVPSTSPNTQYPSYPELPARTRGIKLGKFTSTIYRDGCLFTGPTPDMPVGGLQKYLSVAAHMAVIEAMWRLGQVIQLPWYPTVEPCIGITL